MICAVFDLDRTLLPGTTAERVFLRFLVRERVIGIRAIVRTIAFALRYPSTDLVLRIRSDRPYLTGLAEDCLCRAGQSCVEQVLLQMLSREGVDQVQAHQAQRHHTVLLSGSLPYVAEPIAHALGFDHVICSRLQSVDGRLRGGLEGLHPYGDAKAELMQAYASAISLELNQSYCYADHHSDIPMLQLFGYPVCVNPSDKLRKYAERSGWLVETYS